MQLAIPLPLSPPPARGMADAVPEPEPAVEDIDLPQVPRQPAFSPAQLTSHAEPLPLPVSARASNL